MSNANRYERLVNRIRRTALEIVELGSSGEQKGEGVTASSGSKHVALVVTDRREFERTIEKNSPVAVMPRGPLTDQISSRVLMMVDEEDFYLIVRAKKVGSVDE